ncbi:MAG: DUF917 domain-containing protein [Acidimicrobiia bacterium]
MRRLDAASLGPLVFGAAVLGAGGGGDPYIGWLLAGQAIAEYGPVTVLDPIEIPDDALCAMSAVMGAPTVLVEKLPSGEEQFRALQVLEEHLGRQLTHIMCAEIGGLNSTLPIVTAARTGLPLVDCDAMGRAFPEIQMSTPTLYGVAAAPMALADEKGNARLITEDTPAADNHRTEEQARAICVEMGGAAFIALFVQSGAQIRQTMIPGTLLKAEQIGRVALSARAAKTDPIAAILEPLGGVRLFEGKIVDVQRRTEAGFARGQVTIEGSGSDVTTQLVIHFQNENLAAIRAGQVAATVPDLITVLEADTGLPITTEELRYGFRVVVIGAPCDSRWRGTEGVRLVGPRYFGFDLDYVPVELLNP